MNFPLKQKDKDWQDWLTFVHNFMSRAKLSQLTFKKQFDNRPYISLDILNFKCDGLLDSGASRTVVNSEFADTLKRLGVTAQRLKSFSMATADGTNHCITKIYDVPVRFNNQFHIMSMLLMPNLSQPLILGKDFFDLFGISFKFRDNEQMVHAISEEATAIISKEDLNEDEHQRLTTIVNEIRDKIGVGLGRTTILRHTIDTGMNKPIYQKQYNFSPIIKKQIERELDDMLSKDVVEPSHSPWCSPIVLVKKADGTNRLCLDSRQLNKVTRRDTYPLPRVASIIDNLRNAKFLSTIDLKSAFWQIELEESSKEKTAFAVPGRGLFHFKVMPFGLVNASQTQQRLMDMLFHVLDGKVWAYLDDIVVCSETFEEHLNILRQVMDILKDAGLTINVEKCKFARSSLRFLGYIVDKDGLRTDPNKVAAILNFPRPKNLTELKRFIGIASWYRRFVKNFSIVAAPLHNLTKGKKNKKFRWNDEAEKAFLKLKTLLTSTPVISCPDFTKPFVIQCDASTKGIGAVLCQTINKIERPIAYLSRKLNDREQLYSTSERELLSIVFAVEKFRPYIEGVNFTVITDHSALKMLHKMKDPHGRLARWAMKLQQFSFDIVHKPGKSNIVPDALSRSIDTIKDNNINSLVIMDKHKDDWYKNKVTKTLHNDSQDSVWKVDNGLLYKKICLKQYPDPTNDWKLYVPNSLRTQILKQCHDDITAGHLGIRKTLFRIKQYYFWPNMLNDVKHHVGKCEVCAKMKVSQELPYGRMGKHRTVTRPWQVISLDLMGPFPKSKKGNTMLLVLTCLFSKFVLLFPLRNGKADKICEIVENQFLLFGIPQAVICDNGKQFESQFFKELVKKYHSQIWYTPNYHPQSNPTERVNRVIGTMISSFINLKKHNEWDVHLQKFAHSIRTAVHETTEFTPSFLFFGRETSIPADMNNNNTTFSLTPEQPIVIKTDKYLAELKKRPTLYNTVKHKLEMSHQRSLEIYNSKHRKANFQVGDVVWKKTKFLSNARNKFMAKLAPKYEKAIITDKRSENVYHLNNVFGKSLGVWHAKDLKPLWSINK